MSRPRYNYQEKFDRARRRSVDFGSEPADARERPRVHFPSGAEPRRDRAEDPPPPSGPGPGSRAHGEDPGQEERRRERAGDTGSRERARDASSSPGGEQDDRGARDERARDSRWTAGKLELTDYHFMILGLRRETATPALIREAYRRAVLSNHPDKNQDDPFALERFKAIQEVYELLCRSVKESGSAGTPGSTGSTGSTG
jgi:hypothetical protein